MYIDSIVFLYLIATTSVLGLAVIILVGLLSNALKKLHAHEAKEEDFERKTHEKALSLVERAREKAFEIIKDAHTQTQNILDETKMFSDTHKSEFGTELKRVYQKQLAGLDKTSQQILESYQSLLNQAQTKSNTLVNKISSDIEKTALSELDSFKNILQKETVTSQKIVAAKIEEKYDQAQREIDAYKKEKLREITDGLYATLKGIAAQSIGDALSSEDHEKLAMAALARAKAQLAKRGA